MSDENNTVDTNDNLDDFSAELFGTKETQSNEPAVEDSSEELDTTDETEEGNPLETDNDDDVQETDESDTDEGDEPDDAEEDEEEEEAKPQKKTSRFQERINELTARAKEAERKEQETFKRLEQAIAKLQNTPDKEVEQNTDTSFVAPSKDDLLESGEAKYPLGEYDPKYIEDLTKYSILKNQREIQAEADKRIESERQSIADQALQSQWQEKLSKAKENLPDLVEKSNQLEDTFRDLDPTYGEYLAKTIMQMDNGPEVLHYLGSNIEEAQEIASSNPTRATLALGRLEAKIAASKTRVPKKVSKAPKPPRTLNRGSSVSKSIAPDTDDLAAFEQMLFRK